MPRRSWKKEDVRSELRKMLIEGPPGRMSLGRMKPEKGISYQDIVGILQDRLAEKGIRVDKRYLRDVLSSDYGGVQAFASLLARRVVMPSRLSEEEKEAVRSEMSRKDPDEAVRQELLRMLSEGPPARISFGRMKPKEGISYTDLLGIVQDRLAEKGIRVDRSHIRSIVKRDYGGVQRFAILVDRGTRKTRKEKDY